MASILQCVPNEAYGSSKIQARCAHKYGFFFGVYVIRSIFSKEKVFTTGEEGHCVVDVVVGHSLRVEGCFSPASLLTQLTRYSTAATPIPPRVLQASLLYHSKMTAEEGGGANNASLNKRLRQYQTP